MDDIKGGFIMFNNGLQALSVIMKNRGKMSKEELDKVVDDAIKADNEEVEKFCSNLENQKEFLSNDYSKNNLIIKKEVQNMQNTDEVKVAKFKKLVENTAIYFSNFDATPRYYYMPFNLPLKDYNIYLKNEYVSVVLNTVFLKPKVGKIEGPSIDEMDKVLEMVNKGAVYVYRNIDAMVDSASKYNWTGSIIFWTLVLATIDENFYNNEINMISDLACIFDFSEEMMNDWTMAVKYFLNGNKFNENMNLEFKSKEATWFFKHNYGY